MYVYPILEIDSLVKRCDQDIEKFITDVLSGKSNSIQSVRYNLYINDNYDDIKSEIGKQLDTMNNILNPYTKNITSFDYSRDILYFTENERNQLWIVRTLLCYQMMIFGTHIMSNSSLHAKVYTDPSKRPFRPDVITELPFFKLGIFGSITPTSDIDIGIQYSGMTSNFAALNYVVAIIEDMFIHFLNITSTLKLDIEYYANLETLPNSNPNNTASPDLFYLDTTTFTEKDFNVMLPYAYASIYRNYITATEYLKTKRNDTDFISRLQTYGVLINENAMNDAKQMVDDYMNLLNDEADNAREKYYELVKNAEEQVAVIRRYIKDSKYENLTNKLIVEAMKAIAHSLIFRAESYVCAPTVMHVVRLLQADPKKEKYPVTYPAECLRALQFERLKNPQCGIGHYGYEMSRLEQIGYILRFQLIFCERGQNNMNVNAKVKCEKKLKKYKIRLEDAILRKNGIPDRTNTIKQKNGVSESMGGRRKLQRKTRRNLRRKHVKCTKRHTRR